MTPPPRQSLQQQLWNLLIDQRSVMIIIGCIILLMPVVLIGIYLALPNDKQAATPYPVTTVTPDDDISPNHSLIDITKLPLGNHKAVTTAQKGFVYTCNTTFSGSGATPGPWIDANGRSYNLTQKVRVNGNTTWPQATIQVVPSGNDRRIIANGLPVGHSTGTFPIKRAEQAYKYEKNPNSIRAQTITLTPPVAPLVAPQPGCITADVGIALNGVPIMYAFDEAGQDAMATELQDNCDGSPRSNGSYHYHGYSTCLKDPAPGGQHSAILGYALDGFGIYGLRGEEGYELSSSDLDECHGHTHAINWDGALTEMYHYHFTRDFPYSVACFKGTPVTSTVIR